MACTNLLFTRPRAECHAGDENQQPAGNGAPFLEGNKPARAAKAGSTFGANADAGEQQQPGTQAASGAVKHRLPSLPLPDDEPAADPGRGSVTYRSDSAGRKRSASDAGGALTARQLEGPASARDMQQQLAPWLRSHQQKSARLQQALTIAAPTDPLGRVLSR